MGKVVLSFTMSLDGFIAGPNVGDEEPMGEGGEQLHHWLFDKTRKLTRKWRTDLLARRCGDPRQAHLRFGVGALGRYAVSRSKLRAHP